jgi:hypothetical protein
VCACVRYADADAGSVVTSVVGSMRRRRGDREGSWRRKIDVLVC